MDSDPYEAINIIDKTKNRDDLATPNTWKAKVSGIIFYYSPMIIN